MLLESFKLLESFNKDSTEIKKTIKDSEVIRNLLIRREDEV